MRPSMYYFFIQIPARHRIRLFDLLVLALAIANVASSPNRSPWTRNYYLNEFENHLEKRQQDWVGIFHDHSTGYNITGYDEKTNTHLNITMDWLVCGGIKADTSFGVLRRYHGHELQNVTALDISEDIIDAQRHQRLISRETALLNYVLLRLNETITAINEFLQQELCPVPVDQLPPGTDRQNQGASTYDELRRRLLMDDGDIEMQPLLNPTASASAVAAGPSRPAFPTEAHRDLSAILWVPVSGGGVAAVAGMIYQLATEPHKINGREVGLVTLVTWLSALAAVAYDVLSKR